MIWFKEFELQDSSVSLLVSLGCCFAFAICGVLETLHHKENGGRRIILSPQDIYNHLIKTKKENKSGCSLFTTVNWVRDNGCVLEETCPYKGTFKPASLERKPYLRITASRFINLTQEVSFSEKDKVLHKELQLAIRNGPVAAQMLWIKEMSRLKGDGVYSGPKDATAFGTPTDQLRHSVIIVGYGQERKNNQVKNYWLIRNSHGKTWGDKGYGKIDTAPCHGRLLVECACIILGVTYEKPNGEPY